MCLLNYNKKEEKYKHLTYAERTMIETWYNSDKKSKREIAVLLHKSERTIRREINRGKIIIRNYDWSEKEEYSARKAQDAYEYGKTGKGPELKLDQDIELVRHIEKEIIKNKKSPEVVSKQLKKENEYLNSVKEYVSNLKSKLTNANNYLKDGREDFKSGGHVLDGVPLANTEFSDCISKMDGAIKNAQELINDFNSTISYNNAEIRKEQAKLD